MCNKRETCEFTSDKIDIIFQFTSKNFIYVINFGFFFEESY